MSDRNPAHDKTGAQPAYVKSDPPPGSRPTMINFDKSGISMSLKTMVAVVTTIVGVILFLVGYAASLTTVDDLADHNLSSVAHAIVIDENGDGKLDVEEQKPKPLGAVVAEQVIVTAKIVGAVDGIAVKVESNTKTINAVQGAQHEQRAEDLAYRAIDQLPKGTPRKRVQRKFEDIKQRAKSNLKAKRDIRDGIALDDF